MSKPKIDGALDITGLVDRNHTLLCKWPWRFACEEGHLWRRVLRYGVEGLGGW